MVHIWIISFFTEQESGDYIYFLNQAKLWRNEKQIELRIFSGDEFLSQTQKPDIIISRLGAKTSEYIIKKLKSFQEQGVYILNSPNAIGEVGDKQIFYQKAQKFSYLTPQTWNLAKYILKNKNIFFPCVLKLRKSMKGEGVFWIQNSQDFHNFSESFGHLGYENFLIQEYISSSHGKDVRVLILGEEILYSMKRVSQNGDFRANIGVGGKGEKYFLEDDIIQICKKIMRDFDLDFAAIDFLFGENNLLLCEVNSSPGFEEGEKVTGQDISEKILKYILKKIQKK